jgi:hypothetical protein
MKISDANIYVVRHEYTEKYMLKMISEKYFNKEVSHSFGLITIQRLLRLWLRLRLRLWLRLWLF